MQNIYFHCKASMVQKSNLSGFLSQEYQKYTYFSDNSEVLEKRITFIIYALWDVMKYFYCLNTLSVNLASPLCHLLVHRTLLRPGEAGLVYSVQLCIFQGEWGHSEQ